MFNFGISSVKVMLKTLGSTFTLLNIGQSSLATAASTSSLTFNLASVYPIPSSNSIIINEKFSWDEDLISKILFTDFSLSSSGSVINFSKSSAVLPGYIELTKTIFSLISG